MPQQRCLVANSSYLSLLLSISTKTLGSIILLGLFSNNYKNLLNLLTISNPAGLNSFDNGVAYNPKRLYIRLFG